MIGFAVRGAFIGRNRLKNILVMIKLCNPYYREIVLIELSFLREML